MSIKSKMSKTQPLMKDPYISSYIPETCWYNQTNLKKMINTYSTVYIKPDLGSKGIGIMRLKNLGESLYELSHGKTIEKLSYNEAVKKIKEKIESNKSYVLQQGINVSTYEKCPFDIRVVMQKVKDRWQLSLMAAKVATTENAVVTNIARGNRKFPLETVLLKNDQKWDGMITLRHLIDLSHQIAHILGEKLPLKIIGLDLAIDKSGDIWFFEANSKPQCSALGKLNDAKSYQKYLEAKKKA